MPSVAAAAARIQELWARVYLDESAKRRGVAEARDYCDPIDGSTNPAAA